MCQDVLTSEVKEKAYFFRVFITYHYDEGTEEVAQLLPTSNISYCLVAVAIVVN